MDHKSKFRRDPYDGSQSRSCLVLGGRKKNKNKSKFSSNSTHTDDISSQAGLLSTPQHGHHTNRDLWTTPEDEEILNGIGDWGKNHSTSEQQQSQSQPPMRRSRQLGKDYDASPSPSPSAANYVPGTPSSSQQPQQNQTDAVQDPSASLLSLPTPTDRSHKTRLEMERAMRKKQVYDGELEPEGVRGQEANINTINNTTTNNSSSSQNDIPMMRSFGNENNQRSASRGANSESMLSISSSTRDIQEMMEDFVQEQPPPPPSLSEYQTMPTRQQTLSEESMEQVYKALDAAKISTQDVSSSSTSNNHNRPQQQPPSSPERSTTTNQSGSASAFRKSAPVDVDDSSFIEPNQNVEGINAMAIEHVLHGEYDMALEAFGQVLQVYVKQYGRKHALVASAYHNLGTVHSKRAAQEVENSPQQRHCREQALLSFQAAARSARDSMGANHPNVAVSLVRIGFLLLTGRQYANAIVTFQEALRIRVAHFGPEHALVANLLNNLGVCHMHLGEFPVGRDYLGQALTIQKNLMNQNHSTNSTTTTGEAFRTQLLELADTHCNIGGLCLEWIRRQGPDARHAMDAESSFLEALEIRQKVLEDPNDPLVQQVRSLYEMVRSMPLPKSTTSSPARGPTNSFTARSRSRSPARRTTTSPRRLQQQQPLNGLSASSLDGSSGLNSSAGQQQQRQAPLFDPTTAGSAEQRLQPPAGLNHPHPSTQDVPEKATTRVIVSPTFVPMRSTVAMEGSSEASYAGGGRTAQSEISSVAIPGQHMYDGEENLLIGLVQSSPDALDKSSNTRASDEKNQQIQVVLPTSTGAGAGGGGTNNNNPGRASATWSTASNVSTDERTNTLMRAREFLDANRKFLDDEDVKNLEAVAPRKASTAVAGGQGQGGTSSGAGEDDGLAPLGGNWPAAIETGGAIHPEMMQRPELYLVNIYEGAVQCLRRGRYSEALHLFELVLDAERDRYGTVHEFVGGALHNVGIANLRLDDHRKALQAFDEAVRVRKVSLGPNHPLVAVSLVKVGIALLLLQRFEDSLWIFREALSVRKQALGALHPSTARIYNSIGCVHVEFGELPEAGRAFEAALDIQRNALFHDSESGPLMFGTATTLCNLAYLYKISSNHAKAAHVLREALGLQEKALGLYHPTVLSTLDSLAEACTTSNHNSDAIYYYSEILDRLKRSNAGAGGTMAMNSTNSASPNRSNQQRHKRAEAVLLYKMSKVHLQQEDRTKQVEKLNQALIAIRSVHPDSETPQEADQRKTLESRIQNDLRGAVAGVGGVSGMAASGSGGSLGVRGTTTPRVGARGRDW